MTEQVVKIVNHGMVNLPAKMRKKLGIKDGDKLVIREEGDGTLKIIPIVPIEILRQDSFTAEEMLDQMAQSRKEELELEK
ncbi:MAG TPA: AbrB/MazE/SpoVT family DNA-binding domain-containing protein [Candidatus Lokiarchaeia archaeon]|nr:AbrB/MazE/SpoVT family DNA-binding domain-containing protein [Candidatus Lokiarchaeia archaeon]